MYPTEGGSAGFYPGDELIGRETSRNREAVLLLLENAACPQAVIGKAAQYCGTAPLTTIFAGDVAQVSPPIGLTGGANFGLSFKYRFGHSRTSSRADYLRVRVIGNVTRTVFIVRGERRRRGATWEEAALSLSRFAGQTVRIQVEAVDRSRKSALKAAVDGVHVTRF